MKKIFFYVYEEHKKNIKNKTRGLLYSRDKKTTTKQPNNQLEYPKLELSLSLFKSKNKDKKHSTLII